MENKLSVEFLKKFGLSAQLEALKKLGKSEYNPSTDKLGKEIDAKSIEGDFENFLKTDLNSVLGDTDLQNLFRLLDANNDGQIDESEAKALGQAGSTGESIDDTDIRTLMLSASQYAVETDNTDRSYIMTKDGKKGNMVSVSELPEGFSVSDGGIIYDANFRAIGETRTLKVDTDGDGIKEEVVSYYRYEEPTVRMVSTKELPEGYIKPDDIMKELPKGYIIQNSKIYDKNFVQIGYVEYEDTISKDGKLTIAKLFLYEDTPKTETPENDNREKFQVTENDLPTYSYILDNKIYSSEGFEIGRIEDKTIENAEGGKSGTVRKYFLYDKPAQPTQSTNTTGTTGSSSGTGTTGTTDSSSSGSGTTQNNVVPKEVDRTTITSPTGQKANIVNISQLPEGYSVGGDGIIYDKNMRKIGETRTQNKDYDGDGIKDSIITYYLYEETPVKEVATKELPEGYLTEEDLKVLPKDSIVQNGKIYDKNFSQIGYVEFEDIEKGKDKVTIARLYLYQDKTQETTQEAPDTRPKYQITTKDLPSDCYILNNKIYSKDGFPIGVVEESTMRDSLTGKTNTVKKYYFYK